MYNDVNFYERGIIYKLFTSVYDFCCCFVSFTIRLSYVGRTVVVLVDVSLVLTDIRNGLRRGPFRRWKSPTLYLGPTSILTPLLDCTN